MAKKILLAALTAWFFVSSTSLAGAKDWYLLERRGTFVETVKADVSSRSLFSKNLLKLISRLDGKGEIYCLEYEFGKFLDVAKLDYLKDGEISLRILGDNGDFIEAVRYRETLIGILYSEEIR